MWGLTGWQHAIVVVLYQHVPLLTGFLYGVVEGVFVLTHGK
jgi:hypothetical protein